MNIQQFVHHHGLREADAVVLKKKFLGMVDHFAIYLGYDSQGKPQFAANFKKGVEIIPESEINKNLKTYLPQRIERFTGNRFERMSAIERAWMRIGEDAYSFIGNNCEHFKNWVHYGRNLSEQVDRAGNMAVAIGGALSIGGALTESNKATNWGVGIFLLGLVMKNLAERN